MIGPLLKIFEMFNRQRICNQLLTFGVVKKIMDFVRHGGFFSKSAADQV